jgi:hypothetical protein
MIARHFGIALLMLIVSASASFADSTLLSLVSEPGDFVGAGQQFVFTPADGSFSAVRNFNNGVSLSFTTPTFSHFWYLDFGAADNQVLTVGPYSGAVRFPFQPPGIPGLSVSGDGRGCNMLTGSFQVLDVAYGPGNDILSFRATFEQHCEGAPPALRGEIRYNATVPIDLTAPSEVSALVGENISFGVSAVEIVGRTVDLSATSLPVGATFTDSRNNTGTFRWTPAPPQGGSYVVAFHADNLAGATETAFTRILVRTPPPPPPPNDDFAGAIILAPALPVSTSQDTSSATTAPDDPFCVGNAASVWFGFTAPANMTIEADTSGSNYDTTLSVYRGSRGALTQLACNDNSDGTFQSRIRIQASAGVTYFFMAAAFPGNMGGLLSFHVKEGPRPLTIAPSIFRFGTVESSTGSAQLSGAVVCSRPTYVSISGQLRQSHGGATLTGFFGTFMPCDGTTSWSAVVQTSLALFHGRAAALLVGGPASVSATVFAFDPDTGVPIQLNFSADVILRGAQ